MPDATTQFPQVLSMTVLLGRMALAIACGALLGWERQRQHKPAGLRTHMLVSLGSAAFMLAALQIMAGQPATAARWDPTRVMQGIIQGIGFLGAGEIIQSRGTVLGITTAAGIWVVSGIGVCCGVGLTGMALILTVLAFLIQVIAWHIERRFFPNQPEAAPTPAKPPRD
jgi:putative Mg2+ transporter-C (MgtC) family protein